MKRQNVTSDTARVIKVIETTLTRRGNGQSEHDPIRVVTQYWSLDGQLLFEVDPWAGAKPSTGERHNQGTT